MKCSQLIHAHDEVKPFGDNLAIQFRLPSIKKQFGGLFQVTVYCHRMK